MKVTIDKSIKTTASIELNADDIVEMLRSKGFDVPNGHDRSVCCDDAEISDGCPIRVTWTSWEPGE